jgi:hypothetical protein
MSDRTSSQNALKQECRDSAFSISTSAFLQFRGARRAWGKRSCRLWDGRSISFKTLEGLNLPVKF